MEKPAEFSGEVTSVLNEDPTGKVVEKQWTSAGKIPQFIIIQRLLCIGCSLRQREEMVEKLFSYSVHFWYVRKIWREKDDVRKRKKIKENLVIYCDYYACVSSGIRQDTARTDKTNKIKWKENERGKLFVKSFSRFSTKIFSCLLFSWIKKENPKNRHNRMEGRKENILIFLYFPDYSVLLLWGVSYCNYGASPLTSYLRFKSNRYNQIHEWWGYCIVTPNEYSVRYRKLHYHSQSVAPLHSP